MHHEPIPRMGGLAIFIGFLLSVLIFAKIDTPLQGILLGAVIIVVLAFLMTCSIFRHGLNLLYRLLRRLSLFSMAFRYNLNQILFFQRR